MLELSLTKVAWWNLRNLGLVQPFSSNQETVQSLVAVQAQDFAAARQAVALRTARAEPLESLLMPGGPLVRLWTVRGTMHLVPAAEAGYHQAATAEEWSDRWGSYLQRRLPMPLAEVRKSIYPRIAEVLSEEPMDHNQIATMAKLVPPYGQLLPHFLKDLCYLGGCVRGPQTGGRAIYFSPWHQLLPPDSDWLAKRFLLHRVIARYGPMTIADLVYWSGFRVPTVRQIVRDLGPDLVAVRMQGENDQAFLLAEQLPQLMAVSGPPPGQKLCLPAFDVLLLAYKNKSRFLDEAFVSKVFLSAARVCPILLQDGRVVGTWRGDPPQVARFVDELSS